MWKLDLMPHNLGVNGSLLSRHLRILELKSFSNLL